MFSFLRWPAGQVGAGTTNDTLTSVQDVYSTPEDTHASFTLELEAGDADLETALIGTDKDGVADFVTVGFEG